jgi:hypothetical protein
LTKAIVINGVVERFGAPPVIVPVVNGNPLIPGGIDGFMVIRRSQMDSKLDLVIPW